MYNYIYVYVIITIFTKLFCVSDKFLLNMFTCIILFQHVDIIIILYLLGDGVDCKCTCYSGSCDLSIWYKKGCQSQLPYDYTLHWSRAIRSIFA